jgi:hypothetical protein
MRSVVVLLACAGLVCGQDLAAVEDAIERRMAATIPFYLEWTEQVLDGDVVGSEVRGRLAYGKQRSAVHKVEDVTGKPWHWCQVWDGTHSVELYGDGGDWSGSRRADPIGAGPFGVLLFGLDPGSFSNLGRSRFVGREQLGEFRCEVWEREELPHNQPVRRWLAIDHGYFPVQVIHYGREEQARSIFRAEKLARRGDAWFPVRIRNPDPDREGVATLIAVDPATLRTELTAADFELPGPRRVRHADGRVERSGWWGSLTLPGWAWLVLEILLGIAVVVAVHYVVRKAVTRATAPAS